jgi:hypothetical protein
MAVVFINQLQGGTTYLRSSGPLSWSILTFFMEPAVCIPAAAPYPEKVNSGNTLTPYFYYDTFYK